VGGDRPERGHDSGIAALDWKPAQWQEALAVYADRDLMRRHRAASHDGRLSRGVQFVSCSSHSSRSNLASTIARDFPP